MAQTTPLYVFGGKRNLYEKPVEWSNDQVASEDENN